MRYFLLGTLHFLLALTACDNGTVASPSGDDTVFDGDVDVTDLGPMITVSFSESEAELVNPERGFYVGYDLRNAPSASGIRASGHSLAIAVVKLPDYRDRPLDQALLTSLANGFAQVRAAGIKLVLRFSYNSAFDADAPKSVVLGHIEQLAPLLQENADVIAVMQAGFIGAWGEWHASTNGLDTPEAQAEILDALLTALPPSRGVQVRTPMAKDTYVPGGPLEESEAYSGSPRARLGHHNDCFLASSSDYGTYDAPVDQWEAYVADDGLYTAIGGETCAIYEPKTNCDAAVATMEAAHWSYLNREYHQGVLAGWVEQGCDGEIRRRLGYRLALERVAHTEQVAPGGVLGLEIDLKNSGFAALYNRRPLEIVLSNGTTRHVARLTDADARHIAAGTSATLTVRLRIPADVAPGTWSLALRLPDEAPALTEDPRYAIQLANDGVWDASSGDNVLSGELVIDPATPGSVDPGATSFAEIR